MRAYLIISFFICCNIYSQQLDFINVGVELKLPAQECYNIMQDSKGYIWFSTEAGLCRYNGKDLKVFDKKNGLPESSCFTVNEDKNGELWITTSTNRILKYFSDSLYEAPFSKVFQNKFTKELEQTYYLKNIDNKYLYLNTQCCTYEINTQTNSIKKINQVDSLAMCSFINKNGVLIPVKVITNRSLSHQKSIKENIILNVSIEGKTRKITIPFKLYSSHSWRILTTSNNKEEHFIGFNNLLIKLNPDLSYSVKELPDVIIALYCDKENDLWVGTTKGGAHYFENSEGLEHHKTYLSGFSVSGICEDHENGIWCSTLEKGIFYCRNKYLKNYSNIPGLNTKPDLLKVIDDKVFISSVKNEIIIIDSNEIRRHQLILEHPSVLDDIEKDNNTFILSGKDIIVRTTKDIDKFVKLKLNGVYATAGAKQLAYMNKRLFGINFGWLMEIKNNHAIEKKSFESPGNCLAVVNNELFVGLKNGLFKVDTMNFSLNRIKEINGNVSKIIETTDHELWLTTKNNGLYIINSTGVTKVKMPTDRLFDIAEDKNKNIWVGSNIGLLKINKLLSGHSIKIYNTLSGLPSDEVYKVVCDRNSVYFSTTEGICTFSFDQGLGNIPVPGIYLKRVEINGKAVASENKMILSYKNNSLKFSFDVLSFKAPNNNLLFYKLTGPEYKEQNAPENNVILNNLKPGKYTLTVFAINYDKTKSALPFIISIEIQKPYWQTVWFIVGCIIIVILLIVLIVNRIIKHVKNKEEEKTKINKLIAESQLAALQAQMNPHFIFNAINSIQTYILENEQQVAYDYLAKFSKLVRRVLQNSKEKSITLEKEIELLTIYIELEQMRFENKFEFELVVADNIDTYEIKLPPMLLQPYVENAIWHGLMPLKQIEGRKLIIHINLLNGLLSILIEDNGIGRDESNKIKKTPGYRSMGMELIEHRIKTLKTVMGYSKAEILVSDLFDDTKKACGTRVEIFIQLN